MSISNIVGIILAGAGLLGVFFVIIKKIPTLVKLQDIQPIPQVGLGERIKVRLKGMRYSTYRPLVLEAVEKNLRKLRLLILKIDNLFVNLIKRARERSQVWQIRSRAWMEHSRLKKKEKIQVLETLDKAEVSEALEKIKKEVAKEEDVALKEKIEAISNGNGVKSEGEIQADAGDVAPSDAQPEDSAVTMEEKKQIDLIAANPKNKDAYRALGFIYLNQKNYSDARACFRRVLKLEPTDEEVKRKLEEIKGVKSKKPLSRPE